MAGSNGPPSASRWRTLTPEQKVELYCRVLPDSADRDRLKAELETLVSAIAEDEVYRRLRYDAGIHRDDVVTAGFLRAWGQLCTRYDPRKGPLEPWVRTVARRACYTALREWDREHLAPFLWEEQREAFAATYRLGALDELVKRDIPLDVAERLADVLQAELARTTLFDFLHHYTVWLDPPEEPPAKRRLVLRAVWPEATECHRAAVLEVVAGLRRLVRKEAPVRVHLLPYDATRAPDEDGGASLAGRVGDGDASGQPEPEALRKDFLREVREGLARARERMHPQDFDILLQRKIHELPYRQIIEILGLPMSENTACVRARRLWPVLAEAFREDPHLPEKQAELDRQRQSPVITPRIGT